MEMDVNPLFALPEGRGAVAADALIRIAEPIISQAGAAA